MVPLEKQKQKHRVLLFFLLFLFFPTSNEYFITIQIHIYPYYNNYYYRYFIP